MRGRWFTVAAWCLVACGGERGETDRNKKPDPGSPAAPRDGAAALVAPKRVDPKAPPADPKAQAVEPPTAAECQAALGTLIKVIPDGVFGDAKDMSYCMAMPRPVVRCLAGVKTEADADGCMADFAGAVAPEPRATRDECRKAIENVRRLVPDMKGDTEEMVTQCADTEPISSVRCFLDAKTVEDLDRCELRGE